MPHPTALPTLHGAGCLHGLAHPCKDEAHFAVFADRRIANHPQMRIRAAAKSATDWLSLVHDIALLFAIELDGKIFTDRPKPVRVNELCVITDRSCGNTVDVERAEVSADIELNRRFGVPASSHAGRVEIERFRLGYGITRAGS